MIVVGELINASRTLISYRSICPVVVVLDSKVLLNADG